MFTLAEIGAWISENESLLSGIAALIVVGGVFLSAVSLGLRQLRAEKAVRPASQSGARPRPDPPPPVAQPEREPAERLTLERLTAPSAHPTKFARSGDVRIAYNERGDGPIQLLLAPGIISHLTLSDNLPSVRNTLEALARFAHVVTFDKRGQGLSDPTLTSPTLEERTADIAAVMDDAGIERAVLLGVSEGGPTCIHFAHSHPERVQGLILAGSTARFVRGEDFPIGIPRADLENVARLWGRGVLRRIFFPALSQEQMDDDTYRGFENLIGPPGEMQKAVEMMIATDVRPLLPHIRVPSLVIHFTGDLAVPIRLGRYLAENLPDAEFLEVNAVDHADLSRSTNGIDRIRAFCERVSEAPAATPA